MYRFEAMDAFVRVVRNGSFASAAGELGVSAGVVTKRIMQLEQMLGAKLLSRTTRRMSVTEIGQRYYKFCDRILREMRLEEAEIIRLQRQPYGQLKVIAPMSFGIMQMGGLIASFMEKYPQVQVGLTIGDGLKGALDLLEYGTDVAIRYALPRDSSLYVRVLGRMRWVVCASPAYLRARGAPRTPMDLAHHACLVTHTHYGDGVWHFTGPDGASSIKVNGPVSPSNAITMRYMVLEGAGIAMLPTFCVGEDLKKGTLSRILGEWSIEDLPICALYPHATDQPTKVKLFVDYLAESLKRPTWDAAVTPSRRIA
jgi:DNA-binding transcriptional LysR family regulator